TRGTIRPRAPSAPHFLQRRDGSVARVVRGGRGLLGALLSRRRQPQQGLPRDESRDEPLGQVVAQRPFLQGTLGTRADFHRSHRSVLSVLVNSGGACVVPGTADLAGTQIIPRPRLVVPRVRV